MSDDAERTFSAQELRDAFKAGQRSMMEIAAEEGAACTVRPVALHDQRFVCRRCDRSIADHRAQQRGEVPGLYCDDNRRYLAREAL